MNENEALHPERAVFGLDPYLAENRRRGTISVKARIGFGCRETGEISEAEDESRESKSTRNER
jgi:hypothetical protein